MATAQQSTWNKQMFGILNAEGKPWSPYVFDSLALAQGYLDQQRKLRTEWNLSKHYISPISVTVRVIKQKK